MGAEKAPAYPGEEGAKAVDSLPPRHPAQVTEGQGPVRRGLGSVHSAGSWGQHRPSEGVFPVPCSLSPAPTEDARALGPVWKACPAGARSGVLFWWFLLLCIAAWGPAILSKFQVKERGPG